MENSTRLRESGHNLSLRHRLGFLACLTLMPIFFARRIAAANVPLLLVFQKNCTHLLGEHSIDFYQSFGHIFMYGRR